MVRHEKMCQKIPADWHKTFAMVGLVGLVGLELQYTTLPLYCTDCIVAPLVSVPPKGSLREMEWGSCH